MEIETSDLKKRMQRKHRSAIKPEPVYGDDFEENYIKAILERVETRPTDLQSMAGLTKGGECVFL